MYIFIMQYKYRYRHLVVIIAANVYVYKYEKFKFDTPFLSFQAKNVFIGESKVCQLTEFSGASDKIDFDGNTLLLECENNEHVYFFGLENFQFKTDDKIIDYISLMGNKMFSYTSAVGEKCTCSISTHYKFIKNDKIEAGTLLNATNESLDPFDYHLEKCGINSFKKLECSQIHTFYPHIEEDEEDEDDDVLVEEDIDFRFD